MKSIYTVLLTLSIGCLIWMMYQSTSLQASHRYNKLTHLDTPAYIRVLMKYYPQVVAYRGNYLYMSCGDSIAISTGRQPKSHQLRLDESDIIDQFYQPYRPHTRDTPRYLYDPGRYRSDAFFKAVYGHTLSEVESRLTTVVWCPKLSGQKIKVTTVNRIDSIIGRLSAELDQHPEWQPYLRNIGGTFVWRTIAGSKRQSMHSYGATIDINVRYSHYWQWDCKCTDENRKLKYQNLIPLELVSVFEKYGFLWGGRWYHYDSMHFEYRPELVLG